MAPSVVQNNQTLSASSASITGTTAGNCVVLAACQGSGSAAFPAAPAGWTKNAAFDSGTGYGTAFYSLPNIGGGTITFSTATALTELFLVEVSGVLTAGPFDTGNAIGPLTGSTDTVSTLAGTSQGSEIAFGIARHFDGLSAGAGWTLLDNHSTFCLLEYKILSAAGTQTATWGVSAPSGIAGSAAIACFKAVSTALPPSGPTIVKQAVTRAAYYLDLGARIPALRRDRARLRAIGLSPA